MVPNGAWQNEPPRPPTRHLGAGKVNTLNIDTEESAKFADDRDNYIVPIIKPILKSKKLTFSPGGAGVDANETIDVTISHGHSERRLTQIAMISSKADPDRWVLAIKNKQSSGPWQELTDKMPGDLLSEALGS